MRRRFFVEHVRNGHAEISGDDAKHLTRVLRVEAGERYEISDNQNVYLAEIETARKEQVVFRTIEKLPAVEPSLRLILCAALIKFDHFEWMMEKATELGVAEIMPVIGARSEHGLERAAAKRIGRWRRIALEASQQSRRAYLPEVHEPLTFEEVIRLPRERVACRYVLDEEPGGVPLVSALPQERGAVESVALLVGPEGGWTVAERAVFAEHYWTAVTMGPLILRAETAAIAALAVVGNTWLSVETHLSSRS